MILSSFQTKQAQLEQVEAVLEAEVLKVPHVEKLLAIKGIGFITVAGFLSKAGEIGRVDSPKQIQKLAGLEVKENCSGKQMGQTSNSKRGRKKLRKILFQPVQPLIRSNAEFSDVYRYYTTRQKNPLKRKQAVIAVGCKLICIFYTLMTKGVDYDASRMRLDIIRPADGEQVAWQRSNLLRSGKRPPFIDAGQQECTQQEQLETVSRKEFQHAA